MKQRNHYAALDGLRGVAAFSVLLYHLGHWLNKPFLASNAGLAVDFFFCLSGYVLSVAYRARLDSGMPATTFMRIRLIRLMPMIVIGTLFSSGYLAVRILFTALSRTRRPTASGPGTGASVPSQFLGTPDDRRSAGLPA